MLCRLLRQLHASESGVTAIEYGLIAAMVSMACITVLMNIQGSLSAMYNNVATSILAGLAASGP
jgi:pilus assembly protein Flp/PilA